MKDEIKEAKARLFGVRKKLGDMAKQGKLSEVFLIKFDQELIKAVDAIEMLEILVN